jgi:hypothetical protein
MYFEISKGYDKLGCKDIGILTSEFEAKTQFLCSTFIAVPVNISYTITIVNLIKFMSFSV